MYKFLLFVRTFVSLWLITTIPLRTKVRCPSILYLVRMGLRTS